MAVRLFPSGARISGGLRSGFPPVGQVGLFLVEDMDQGGELVPYMGHADGSQEVLGDLPTPAFFAAQRAQGVDFVTDSLYEASTSASPAANSVALQAAINAADGHASSVGILYGTRALMLPPGVYQYDTTLAIPESLYLMSSTGVAQSVVLHYTGTGSPWYVHTTELTNAATPTEAVRFFGMRGITTYAPNATSACVLGAKVFRFAEFIGCRIAGMQSRALTCGESVYFLRWSNSEVTDCDEGIYVPHYCDLFTVDDRSLFTDNRGPDLIIAAPSYLITNTDFEGADAAGWVNAALPKCHIEIRQVAAVPAANRNGLIFANRFGPEGADPADYDIAFTRGDTSTSAFTTDGVVIEANIHQSAGGATTKIAPVLIDCPIKNTRIEGNYFSSTLYSAGYYAVTSSLANAFATGHATTDNKTDDILKVQPDLRGLFGKFDNDKYEQVISASATISALVATYYINYPTTFDAGRVPRVAALAASSVGTNYAKYAGVIVDAAVAAERHTIIAKTGAVIDTTLDSSAGAYFDPVYVAATTGALTLTAPSTAFVPLIVGRVMTVGTNCRVLLTPPEPGLRAPLTYSASITPTATAGEHQVVTATNATAFTINAPTGTPKDGQLLTFTIRNGTGGALGVLTWNAVFKMTAWTQPATVTSRSISFRWNGTNWVEVARTAADVPN